MFYAQIDSEGLCVGVSDLKGEADAPGMIEIDAYSEDYLGKRYEAGSWVDVPQEQEPGDLTDTQIIMLALADLAEEIAAIKEAETNG